MTKKRGDAARLPGGDYEHACEVAARCVEEGQSAKNKALVRTLREAAAVFRAVESTGHVSARRDGNWIVFQMPEDRAE